MLNEADLQDLRQALMALRGDGAQGAWDALPALARLDDAGYRIQIDVAATRALGAPMVVLHACERAFAVLSPRQRQVARAMSRGLSNAEIARELGVSVATVKDHVHAVLSKLGITRRAEIHSVLQPHEV